MFHDVEMEHMQTELKLRVIDLLFEEDAKKELIELLSGRKK